ncbi:hypothetical protein C7271_19135 [filamentous cyanobacterium CCP5]|nr:hypothetical protein C7271_19135 [filamentous cyanobacterium CCP5]
MPVSERWCLVQTLLISIQQETRPAVLTDEPAQSETADDEAISSLHPWTQSLIGILPPTSEEMQTPYINYLEEKYA